MHPFAPADQSRGYHEMFAQLEKWLAEITGFAAVSLQPNAGSQGEYAGLLVIRAYHESRDDKHKDQLIKSEFAANAKVDVSRFKGLGEMNAAQLKETTMLPAKRTLLKVQIAKGDRTAVAEAVNALMGSKPEARFRFIQERAAFAKDLDI